MKIRIFTGFLVALFLLVLVAGPSYAAGKGKGSGCDPLTMSCPPSDE